MVLFSLAKLISLVQKQIILNRFGVGAEWDTFVAANQVPEQVVNLIAGGALTYAFIPVFGGLLTRFNSNSTAENQAAVWKLASNVWNTIFATALVMAVLIFISAPWLVAHVVAPGFNAESAAQTVGLMRILVFSLLIFSVSGLTVGVLQSHQRFVLPALAAIVYDFGVLFGAIVLSRRFGVYGIAYGAVIGAAGHFLIQVPGLIACRAHWQLRLDWRDPDLRRVIRLMIPRAIGLGLLNVNLLIAINMASGLGAGASSAYNWGWGLMQLPETLIGTAMGVVIFPTLATLSAANDLNGKRAALSGAWRFILIGAIPSAVLMIVAGRQLLSLLKGGAFDTTGVNAIYSALVFFALGLIAHSSVEVVARSFYADQDMVTPLFVAMLSAVINFTLLLLVFNFARPYLALDVNLAAKFDLGLRLNPLSVAGLALANTIAVSTEVGVLIFILHRRWQGLDDRALWLTAGKALVSSVVMGAVVAGLFAVLGEHGPLWLRDGLALLVGAIVFIGVALLLRTREVTDFIRLVARRTASTAK
jgi:putative peptidoglycan lipid II flippase